MIQEERIIVWGSPGRLLSVKDIWAGSGLMSRQRKEPVQRPSCERAPPVGSDEEDHCGWHSPSLAAGAKTEAQEVNWS